jgi:transcription elongation factor SPT6
MYLLVLRGVEQKLLKLKIEGGDTSKMLPEIYDLYLTESGSSLATLWNEQRRQILNTALDKFLLPMLRSEVKNKLHQSASGWVAHEYNREIRRLVNTGPYRLPEIDEMRVMACHWPDRNEPAACVTLDAEGQVLDYLTIAANTMYQARMEDDQQLIRFIVSTRPRVMVVATGSMTARTLKERLDRMTEQMQREYEMAPKAVFVDARVARLRSTSTALAKEFPAYSVSHRLAISLARFVQEPLTEVTALCNSSNDITGLCLYAQQNSLDTESVTRLAARALIDSVNAVGVDLNRIRAYPHTSNMLQFVCGLGPRKVVGLLRSLRPSKKVRSREELKTVLPERVWTNCAGFVRISSKYCPKSHTVLDDTRVHPEDYVFATTMVHDALEIDVETNSTDELHQLIKDVIEQPDKLRALEDIDLDDFAVSWEQQHHVRKRQALYNIQAELKGPFADMRPALLEPNSELLFELLSGENDATLARGQLITAVVTSVDSHKARCRLESGLTGFLRLDDYDGEVQAGNAIQCRVKEVIKDRFLVMLSGSHLRYGDTHADDDADDQSMRSKTRSKLDDTVSRTHRFVVHTLFKNVSSKGAAQLLHNKSTGDVVFRPAKDAHHLVLTYKFHDQLVNVLVAEQNKPTEFALGKTLVINDYTFEDLNEIVARYVDPIAMYAQEMSEHRKFLQLPRADIEAKLADDKNDAPKSLPYYFTPSTEYPGRYALLYLPHERVKCEYITVLPSGFRYRGQRFKQVDAVANYFKKHWRSAPPSSSSHHVHHVHHAATGSSAATGAAYTAVPWAPSTSGVSHWAPQQHLPPHQPHLPGVAAARGAYTSAYAPPMHQQQQQQQQQPPPQQQQYWQPPPYNQMPYTAAGSSNWQNSRR